MGAKLVDVLSLAFVVGAIMVLSRPGSQGPKLVDSLASGITGLLVVSTGSGIPAGYQAIKWA